ncbi:hypothetical protein MIND_00891900 [Mycena indigotica]|uniref:F-box domain-containing protein n=1 Tax=Mycena indigotica TaxID=2126181 RepID=A0A8H6SH87_9AGAR|nr:uncharacterized protein MIND_00891900 [Mycena indigotica]KAF7299421.1 hypothetical protein MIND_00891900 [Mycena indigotica]
MHAALQERELLDLICAELRLARTAPSMRGLASLARTCRGFTESVLDALWFTQTNILPTFDVFPGDLLHCAGRADGGFDLYLRQPLWPHDLLYALRYTRRVRHLICPPYEYSGIWLPGCRVPLAPDCVVSKCEGANPGLEAQAFFPQLILIMISAPRLTHLQLRMGRHSALGFLLPVASRLQVLVLESRGIYDRLSEYPIYSEVNPMAPQLRNIRVLAIGNLDDVGLSHIAGLPHLTELELRFLDGGVDSEYRGATFMSEDCHSTLCASFD